MPLSLRPHPHEYLGNWTEFQRRAAVPFVIDRSLHLDRWIRSCGAVITTFSTTGIDCVAQGVPTISLHRMIPQKFFDALPPEKAAFLSNISWAPATLEELDALLAQARNGTLALAPEGDSFDRFVAENFNVPRSRFACEVIAEDLLGLLQAAPKAMPPASNVTGAVRYWGSSLKSFLSNHRRENIYFPFSLRVRREAREFSRVLRSRAPVGPR
jgi:hypothetical protein